MADTDRDDVGSRRLLRLVWALLVAVASVLGLGATGVWAQVDERNRGPGLAHPATWLGSHGTFGGDPWAWCVDAGRAAPEPGFTWTGRPLEAPRTSYLLTRYAAQETDEVHAALAYLVHTSAELPHDPRTRVPSEPPTLHGVDLGPTVRALAAEAAAAAGPYDLQVSLDVDPQARSATARVLLAGASGAPVAGWPVDVTVTGPAEPAGDGGDAGGTEEPRVSATRPLEVPLRLTGDGTVTVAAKATVPAGTVTLHTADRAGVQRVVTPVPPVPVTGQATADVLLPFAPSVVTRTSAERVTAGTPVTDHLEVGLVEGTWPDGHAVVVTSTLWGPFPEAPAPAPEAPPGAPAVGTVETVVTGPGRYETPPLTPEHPGWYVWTERVPADERQPGWAGRFGLAAETTLVEAPAPPEPTVPPVPEGAPPPSPAPPEATAPPQVPAPPEASAPPEVSAPPEATVPPAVPELPRTGGVAVVPALAGAALVGLGISALAAAGAGRPAPPRRTRGRYRRTTSGRTRRPGR